MLLQEKQIQLSTNHTIPSAEELKKKRYCKWHNSISHHTNDCKVFHQQIQSAIEQGRIKLDTSKKPMKVDGHPFSVNVVDVAPTTEEEERRLRTMLLTSEHAKRLGTVNPRVQLSATDLRRGKWADQVEEDPADGG